MLNKNLHIRQYLDECYLLTKVLIKEFLEKDCQKSAAALTYMSLFALVPMLTVAYLMFSVVPAFDGVAERLQDMIFENFIPETGEEVIAYLKGFSEQASNLTATGIAVLAITAYFMLSNIEKTLNHIWGVKKARRGLNGFLLYWAVLSLGPLLLGAGLLVSTYFLSLSIIAGSATDPALFNPLIKFIPLLMSATAFTLVFVAVPNCRVPIRYASIAGAITALFVEVLKALFGAFVAHTSIQLIYGAFAAIPLFLLWLNLMWVILLSGAILVKVLTERNYQKNALGDSYILKILSCLHVFYRNSLAGEEVTDQACLRSGLGLAEWQALREKLYQDNIVSVTEEGNYVLRKSLKEVTLWNILVACDTKLKDLEWHGDTIVNADWLAVFSEKQEVASKQVQALLGEPIEELFCKGAEVDQNSSFVK